jgi:hypothetical protein
MIFHSFPLQALFRSVFQNPPAARALVRGQDELRVMHLFGFTVKAPLAQ